jgi:hypothetical protein
MARLSEPHYAILTEWDQIDFDVAGEEEEEVRRSVPFPPPLQSSRYDPRSPTHPHVCTPLVLFLRTTAFLRSMCMCLVHPPTP